MVRCPKSYCQTSIGIWSVALKAIHLSTIHSSNTRWLVVCRSVPQSHPLIKYPLIVNAFIEVWLYALIEQPLTCDLQFCPWESHPLNELVATRLSLYRDCTVAQYEPHLDTMADIRHICMNIGPFLHVVCGLSHDINFFIFYLYYHYFRLCPAEATWSTEAGREESECAARERPHTMTHDDSWWLAQCCNLFFEISSEWKLDWRSPC